MSSRTKHLAPTIESMLSLAIRDGAERAVGLILTAAVERALADFDTLLGPREKPFEPTLPRDFKPDPPNGLDRPLPGWEERCKKAILAYAYRG